LEKAEKQLIARALQETNWQKTKAADLLGISRATLYAKVKQHSIEIKEEGESEQVQQQSPSECIKS
jgi:DNA-binding NtrC family response regulator